MTAYRPGSFFLTSITGPTGFLIGLGQALCGDGSRYHHAGIVLDESGTILEAEPGGARISNLSEYKGRPLLISDAPVQLQLADRREYLPKGSEAFYVGAGSFMEGYEEQVRANIVTEARKLVGVPYSGLDYAALALLHLHLPSSWIRRRVESSGHLICSALCDRVYANAGVHLFSDGRLPGDVMPADLAAFAEDWQATQ